MPIFAPQITWVPLGEIDVTQGDRVTDAEAWRRLWATEGGFYRFGGPRNARYIQNSRDPGEEFRARESQVRKEEQDAAAAALATAVETARKSAYDEGYAVGLDEGKNPEAAAKKQLGIE